MAISLFQHNKEAYQSAVCMLSECGRAAVVHPTGTGKSFIGFKLCEDNPGQTVCWISPSDYICRTQLENLANIADGYQPENITFLTYAKLMNLTEDEISNIQPDYIVLDEFHRAGAREWGRGVETLLSVYPDVPVLGLSATNVRYLDNNRDMADELFAGNIASNMTLGEAVVRGVLNPPKYVISLFSYQKDLEKYAERIRKTKNAAVRDEAEKYLEELRRALEKSDGLEDVFDKHMTVRSGKYIVFCANAEHMYDMMDKAKEWFAKVDKEPRMYSVYSADAASEQSFEDFKKDDKDDHLRLLFCIDALNEGIHLEDIDGVILLRPTVSPIVYKQQIGRALSASSRKDAVIFDIVMNIENLYSVGAVEEEMQTAAAYYRALGEEDAVINERFGIIDVVKDCRMLFEKLDAVLDASWDVMYEHVCAYYYENGDLNVPARYRTEDGYALGGWIVNQRAVRRGKMSGVLTKEQIEKLDEIDMVWEYAGDLNWAKNYSAAVLYYKEHGNLNVPSLYVTEDGTALGNWLSMLRTWEKAGVHPRYLTPERKAQLDALGMIWDKTDYYWERNFLAASRYYKKHGNLEIPSTYATEDGIRLGAWLAKLRDLRAGKLKRGLPPTKEQVARLDAIGMSWGSTSDSKWEKGYAAAKEYKEKHGNFNVPDGCKTADGLLLKSWLQNQRKRYQSGKLEADRKERLEAIGMVWTASDSWMEHYEMLVAYFEEHGTLAIPQNYVEDGVWLGKWAVTQKKAMEQGRLSAKRKELLAELPMEQVDSALRTWNVVYEDAAAYYKENGSLDVPRDYVGKSGTRLAAWFTVQRRKRKNGELSEVQIEKLDAIGFAWTVERGRKKVA